ncbi:MAG: hypothetical protein ACLSDO_01460 [Anaerotruncus colihominis]
MASQHRQPLGGYGDRRGRDDRFAANDSYLCCYKFGEMTPDQGYKTQTMGTLILGIAAMAEIFVLSLVF